MEHYQQLILKSLINGGGSTSEGYVHSLLTGTFTDKTPSVSEMWGYLDAPLKEILLDIFDEVCREDLKGLSDSQRVTALIEYMAEKAGRREFFANTDMHEINRMSEDEYESAIDDLVNINKSLLLDKE